MIIRAQQMNALREASLRRFEDDAASNLRVAAPRHYEILGEAGMREAVRFGLRKANSYGIVSERGVLVYIDLMFMLCREFDSDMQYKFAVNVLSAERHETEQIRVDRLYGGGIEYIERVSGPQNEHVLAALGRIRERLLSSTKGLETVRLATLQETFPEKYAHLGEDCLQRLIQTGAVGAAKYGFTSEPGVGLYTGLMFMLGTAFDRDPLHAWTAAALSAAPAQPESERLKKLRASVLSALDWWTRNPARQGAC